MSDRTGKSTALTAAAVGVLTSATGALINYATEGKGDH
jgi:hypothetical protein